MIRMVEIQIEMAIFSLIFHSYPRMCDVEPVERGASNSDVSSNFNPSSSSSKSDINNSSTSNSAKEIIT